MIYEKAEKLEVAVKQFKVAWNELMQEYLFFKFLWKIVYHSFMPLLIITLIPDVIVRFIGG